jgi:hypothetical protein
MTMSEVETPATPAHDPQQPRRLRRREDDGNDRVKIILERTNKIPKIGLNVGHNGVNYLIKPGVPVNIPRKVLNVLKDAVASEPQMDDEGNIIGYEDRSAYPFRYVD